MIFLDPISGDGSILLSRSIFFFFFSFSSSLSKQSVIEKGARRIYDKCHQIDFTRFGVN